MSRNFSESLVEDVALAWLKRLGYTVLHRPDISPNEVAAEEIMRRPV